MAKSYIEQYYDKIQAGEIVVSKEFLTFLEKLIDDLKSGKIEYDKKRIDSCFDMFEELNGRKPILFEKACFEVQWLVVKNYGGINDRNYNSSRSPNKKE